MAARQRRGSCHHRSIMPEQEGLEKIQFLRNERPDLKTIAMSGTAEGQYLPLAEKLGADVTLPKPLRAETLFKDHPLHHL